MMSAGASGGGRVGEVAADGEGGDLGGDGGGDKGGGSGAGSGGVGGDKGRYGAGKGDCAAGGGGCGGTSEAAKLQKSAKSCQLFKNARLTRLERLVRADGSWAADGTQEGVRRGHMCDVHGSDGRAGGQKGTVEGACGVRANGARLRARARLGGHRTGYEGRESRHGPRRSTSRDVVHDL